MNVQIAKELNKLKWENADVLNKDFLKNLRKVSKLFEVAKTEKDMRFAIRTMVLLLKLQSDILQSIK